MTMCCDLCLVTLLMVVVGYFWLAKLHADQKRQQHEDALLLGATQIGHKLSQGLTVNISSKKWLFDVNGIDSTTKNKPFFKAN